MKKNWWGEAQLTQANWEDKNSSLKLKWFTPGETIFSSETSPENLYFSVNGVVKLTKIERTGKEILMVLLPEQSWFGLLPWLSAHREYQAVALTPVSLISLSARQFQQELAQSAELGRLITQQLSVRLLTAEMLLESRLRKTLEARLISFLLILALDFGVSEDSGIKIDLRLSHQTLAELLDSSRVTVTKLLGQLRQRQMISSQQQQITLHNPSALSQYVDFSLPYPSGF